MPFTKKKTYCKRRTSESWPCINGHMDILSKFKYIAFKTFTKKKKKDHFCMTLNEAFVATTDIAISIRWVIYPLLIETLKYY